MLDGVFDFVSEKLLQFFGWVSSLIYGMVSIVTQGFFNVSYIEIFTSEAIQAITARIYVVLAVFMIFKLAFSLIQYLVNPDQVNDKQAGMGKLISRTVTAFIMLIGVPILFNEFIFGPPDADSSNTYQAIIARSIPKIILGSSGDENEPSSIGETMAATAFSAFVQPREECEGAPLLTTATISDIADATYARCSEVVDGGKSNVFAYDYNWLFGLVVGLIMLLIMLFFTVDIAIRAIKLGILRVIAPIPIISYIDPKSAKDGSFNNWLKALISTFAELFIKLAVIYIIMYVIIKMTAAGENAIDFGSLSDGEALYARVFIIIGLLLFAVQASAFIKNIFGIKDQGLGTGLGMLLGGAGALLAGGGIAGMVSGMKQGGLEGAQGKANFGNYNKGKELAAKTAKGKAAAAKREMKRNERLAERFGLNERYNEAERAARQLESQAALAEAEASADGATVEQKRNAAILRQQATQAREAANTAKDDRKDPWGAWAKGHTPKRPENAIKYQATKTAKGVAGAVGAVGGTVSRAVSRANDYRKNIDLYHQVGGTSMDAVRSVWDDHHIQNSNARKAASEARAAAANAYNKDIDEAKANAQRATELGYNGLDGTLGKNNNNNSGSSGGLGGTP